MARQFDGTNDYLVSAANIDLSSGNKLTVAYWLWWDSFVNGGDHALEFTANLEASEGGWDHRPDAASSDMRTIYGKMSGFNQWHVQVIVSRPSAAAWHHYMLTYDRTAQDPYANSKIYIDGSLASATYSHAGVAPDSSNWVSDLLYVMSRGGTTEFGAGRVADLALWNNSLLTATDAVNMAAGYHPNNATKVSVTPTQYWPLLGTASPEPATIGGVALTVSGAVFVADPPYAGGGGAAKGGGAKSGGGGKPGQIVSSPGGAESHLIGF